MLIQHYINVVQGCFDVVSTLCNVVLTSGSDVLSTLCDVETRTLDFVSFSTSDQRYFNVDAWDFSRKFSLHGNTIGIIFTRNHLYLGK